MAYKYTVQTYDRWLAPWLPTVVGPAGTVLDLGCGPGLDSQFLREQGLAVDACDISEEAIAESRKLNPGVRHMQADARDLAPYADGKFDLVVAGLSLHYFEREDSHRAFGAVHRVLKPDGFFLFRLNAWDDHEFGAPRDFHPWRILEESPVSRKQFFSDAMIRELLAGRFKLLSLEKKRSDRYQKPKSFYEGCAKRLAPDAGSTC
ncbi:MAG TPA: class I SAM-dependent methyltransferase [Opitutaceae bacterium]|nr:class I SAM-dependent methyltransferase [Opitutaceae bacterium]